MSCFRFYCPVILDHSIRNISIITVEIIACFKFPELLHLSTVPLMSNDMRLFTLSTKKNCLNKIKSQLTTMGKLKIRKFQMYRTLILS